MNKSLIVIGIVGLFVLAINLCIIMYGAYFIGNGKAIIYINNFNEAIIECFFVLPICLIFGIVSLILSIKELH